MATSIHASQALRARRLVAACIAMALLPAAGALADVRTDGAFGFPQASAIVLCDTPELRVSAACDGTHWFVQAVLWTDRDAASGLTDDGRAIGDGSSLVIDADADGAATKDLDRTYALNPWPSLPGLHYSVCLGERSSTGLKGDSKGRGSIQYVEDGEKTVRVDSYLIPLAEIGRAMGEPVRFAFWASSTVPELTLNSVGFTAKDPKKKVYPHSLPREQFHAWTVAATQEAPFDAGTLPEGRETIEVTPSKAMPAIGTKVGEAGGPPEIAAKAWKNWKAEAGGAEKGAPPTLAGLKGQVVVVEFWATWCGPCVAGIPHLNEMHQKHHKDGLVILSLTDQDPSKVESFVADRGDAMSYAVGLGSTAVSDYGVRGIPHAFVIGRDGVLAWSGHPADKAFDEAVLKALAAK